MHYKPPLYIMEEFTVCVPFSTKKVTPQTMREYDPVKYSDSIIHLIPYFLVQVHVYCKINSESS